MTASLPRLRSIGRELDLSDDAFGFLRGSSERIGDPEGLRRRLDEDGYLFLPGALARDDVREARAEVCRRLGAEGLFDPDTPEIDGRLRADAPNPYFRADVTHGNDALLRVLYDGPMMAIFRDLFGAPVRHYDYTWFRAVGPGHGTQPHCDVVYMGRGTHDLLTAWTPIGDIPLEVGGLIVLENSHRRTDLTGEYLRQDVDTYCENGPGAEAVRTGKIHWEHWQRPGEAWNGAITDDPPALRRRFGGRWLTAPEYRMGDVLIFTMATVHASIDNQSPFLRLSSDSRYQRADAPIDDRWIAGPSGEPPINHTLAAKRGRIC